MKTMVNDDRTTVAAGLPVVVRPRPLLLSGLEELVATQGRFAARLLDRPEQVEAIARVVFAHDPRARETFGDEATLLAYVRRLLSSRAA